MIVSKQGCQTQVHRAPPRAFVYSTATCLHRGILSSDPGGLSGYDQLGWVTLGFLGTPQLLCRDYFSFSTVFSSAVMYVHSPHQLFVFWRGCQSSMRHTLYLIFLFHPIAHALPPLSRDILVYCSADSVILMYMFSLIFPVHIFLTIKAISYIIIT